MADIVVNHLMKRYGPSTAVDDVTMDVKDGELSVLLGPSGSGKTTLLRCLAGLEVPDAGSVSIGGRDMAGVTPREREVSMVFQSYALFPLMSVRDNIAFPLAVRKVPKEEARRKAADLAERLGIGGLLDKMPRKLSGGEQQRVAIARALIRETSAILMDEPLSNLDAPLRAQLRMELKAIQRDFGRTMVYVTHDQVEAMTLADRMGVMKKGRLLQYDSPMHLYASPASSFVAGFVGNPPSSLLKLAVRAEGSAVSLRGGGVDLILPALLAEKLRAKAGSEVVLALRGEGLAITSGAPEDLRCVVQLVEHLGASSIIDLKAGEFALRSSAPASFSAEPGSEVWVGVDFSKASVFDPATDERLI